MRPHDSEDSRHNIDWFIFIGTAAMVVAVCLPLILFPGPGGEVAMGAFRFITAQFGFAYLWSATAALAFLAWLALGPYGRVHLGPEGSSPEFSTFSWAAMLFCGGIGATLLYWGTIEWVYYYEAPPFGEVPGTEAALEWASSYPIYHWGITGWALYCIPAVAMAHAYHVRNISSLRMSAACRPTIGKHADGHLGRLIDLTFMVGIVGGSATGVGFSAPLITASISHFADVPEEDYMTLLAVFLGTALFATSVYAGLERGIRRLSNINAGLAIGFLVFIFVAGPTLFILTESTKAVLFMARNFVQMTIWGDPLATTEFTRAWTVFYWAWWIAMAPYMGIFISKISRGRTIRQLIFGVVGFGSLGCTAFFCVLGNYAVFLEFAGQIPVIETLNDQSAAAAVVKVVTSLPSGIWILPMLSLIALIFMATTYDSASYTLSACATQQLPANRHPARWHRVFWALSLGILPTALLMQGDLRALQSAVVVVSLPLIAVGVLMCVALVQGLRSDRTDSDFGT